MRLPCSLLSFYGCRNDFSIVMIEVNNPAIEHKKVLKKTMAPSVHAVATLGYAFYVHAKTGSGCRMLTMGMAVVALTRNLRKKRLPGNEPEAHSITAPAS